MTKDERLGIFWKLMGIMIRQSKLSDMVVKLEKLGFFDAPASRSYHGNYEGGLFNHSVAVTNSLLKLTEDNELKCERKESPYIIGMFHDLCKCDQYIRVDGGYAYDNNLVLTGHGDKSVILAQQIMSLTEEEILCIRWHMGAYDKEENWNHFNAAIRKYNNVLWTHVADMIASQIEGV